LSDGSVRGLVVGAAALLALGGGCAGTPARPGPAAPRAADDSLIIYYAGSLAAPLRILADSFARQTGTKVRLASGGSVVQARLAMEPDQVPDVLALADYAIILRLLLPGHADWYAAFARNAMVLLFTERSTGSGEIRSDNWMDVLLRAGVRAGHSDPALDPAGYRARLVFALAERYYGRPGLAAALDRAVPVVSAPPGRNMLDLLKAGELDYVVAYRTTARTEGLRAVELPHEIDLSDPGLAADYGRVRIRVARPRTDSSEIAGEPILYGVTVPRAARHRAAGEGFVRLLLSPTGRQALEQAGFVVPARPTFEGRVPASIRPR
jgi:molybdate/tungstate transport system substrate-binding protein